MQLRKWSPVGSRADLGGTPASEAGLILLTLALAHAACPTPETLDGLVEQSSAAIEADDLDAHDLVWSKVEATLRCVDPPADPKLLARLFIDRALRLRASKGDWEALVGRALAIDPGVGAPTWLLKGVEPLTPVRVEPSPTQLYVDGVQVEGSPVYTTPRLFQRPGGEGHIGTSAPRAWTNERRMKPPVNADVESKVEAVFGLAAGLVREQISDRGAAGSALSGLHGQLVLSAHVDVPIAEGLFLTAHGRLLPQSGHFGEGGAVGLRADAGVGWEATRAVAITGGAGIVGVPLGAGALTMYPTVSVGLRARDENWWTAAAARGFPGLLDVEGFAGRRLGPLALGIELEALSGRWRQEFELEGVAIAQGNASHARIGLGLRWSPEL